ncbi:MAG TPA: phosphodiesterase [Solirubrobacteraceae bacterium]|nr:phosphodiesterase [Solirubrobacteraceae bacterium]
MPAPFLVAQISDPHIGGDWGSARPSADPVTCFTRALDAVLSMPDRPDVLLITGDLVEHGTDEEYEVVHRLLAAAPVPVHVLPGNHDLREQMRAAFGLPGDAAAPIQYSADLGPMRLVTLDTIIPGRAGGELDAARLTWLDAELALAPDQPTLLAMHHPPARTGIAPWDAIGLDGGSLAAVEEIVERHPQVQRIVAGHIHQPLISTLAGRAVLTIPSTYVQARVDFTSSEIELGGGVPGFGIHALVDGRLASYLHLLG